MFVGQLDEKALKLATIAVSIGILVSIALAIAQAPKHSDCVLVDDGICVYPEEMIPEDAVCEETEIPYTVKCTFGNGQIAYFVD